MLGVTGHRPNKLGGYAFESKLRDFAISQIKAQESACVMTGMAVGWDQAVAYACVLLRVPFIAAVPFAGQESVWPPQAKRDYAFLLDRAEEVVTVSRGGYSKLKMQIRNEYIVDHSDEMLALYDGTSGGTANCFDYALKRGVTTTNCYEDWLKFIRRNP